jgi:hypothetical protein
MTNEAADLLRAYLGNVKKPRISPLETLNAALAAERRATVERIRAAMDIGPCHECSNADEIYRALDAEEQR